MEKKASRTQARLAWAAACERLGFALRSPDEAPAGSAPDLEAAVRLAHAALDEVRAAVVAQSTGRSKKESQAHERGTGGSARGTRKVTIGGEHVHACTGDSLTYQVDLHHGPESTYYAARVLLRGDRWHELEAGTVAGPDEDVRTPRVLQAVLAQIDGLDFEALNRG